MIIDSVQVLGFRSVQDSGVLELGPVTVFTGRNNSGKSALLRALYLLQEGSTLEPEDFRLRGVEGIEVRCAFDQSYRWAASVPDVPEGALPDAKLTLVYDRPAQSGLMGPMFIELSWLGGHSDLDRLPADRRENLFVPVFARRKTMNYPSEVRREAAWQVMPTDQNLASRLAALLSSPNKDAHRYQQLVESVLQLPIGTYLSDRGQVPGIAISADEGISINRMGEGVSGVLTLLAELATAERRVFLVEEPENDLHPRALDALLDVMIGSSTRNQFLVSTHSDQVLRRLGSQPGAVVYQASLIPNAELFTTRYTKIETEAQRLDCLADLGYDPELPPAWLLLEESSMERVINDVLIPMFVPTLARLRTISARGVQQVPKRFAGLHSFILFAHLSKRYEGRVWTLVDGDEGGRQATEKLQRDFTWPPGCFRVLERPDLESYYPLEFADEVAAIHQMSHGLAKQEAKCRLLEDICGWTATADEAQAKASWESSAEEIITILRSIDEAIKR